MGFPEPKFKLETTRQRVDPEDLLERVSEEVELAFKGQMNRVGMKNDIERFISHRLEAYGYPYNQKIDVRETAPGHYRVYADASPDYSDDTIPIEIVPAGEESN